MSDNNTSEQIAPARLPGENQFHYVLRVNKLLEEENARLRAQLAAEIQWQKDNCNE